MSDPLERARRAVLAWCALYTRGVPSSIAAARREELDADLCDQIAWAHETGGSARSAARAIRLRALRGAVDDLAWRTAVGRGSAPSTADRVLGSTLLTAVGLGGVAMILFSLVAVERALQLSAASLPSTLPTLVAALAAACGLTLLARPRTRAVGAAWLLVASQLTVYSGITLLAATSTSLSLFAAETQQWPAYLALIGTGVGVLHVAAAAWWISGARPETAR